MFAQLALPSAPVWLGPHPLVSPDTEPLFDQAGLWPEYRMGTIEWCK